MTGQHSDSCDVGPWEVRAVQQLAEVIRSAMADSGPEPTCEAIAAAVWSELTYTPVSTGDHPARDLTAWYLLANVGAHMLEVFDGPPEVGLQVLIPRHALGQYLQANLDRLRVANLEPSDITGSTP